MTEIQLLRMANSVYELHCVLKLTYLGSPVLFLYLPFKVYVVLVLTYSHHEGWRKFCAGGQGLLDHSSRD